MRILHINPGFPFTALYRHMLDHFKGGECHHVYTPLAVGRKIPERLHWTIDSRVTLSRDYGQLDRLFHGYKARKISKKLEEQIDLQKVDLIHAHFLFSAGGVASILKKKYGIKYVVSIRDTDVNTFFKYGFHLRDKGLAMLDEAERIIFINPAYRDYVLTKYVPPSKRVSLERKVHVLPNGVAPFWLENLSESYPRTSEQSIALLFVGEFSKRKNVRTVVEVARYLHTQGQRVTLDLVGDGRMFNQIQAGVASEKYIRLHGRVDDKTDLLRLYREADIFLMPSFTETFGLVYVEAMSQGLPVLYSVGQGIDGFFPDGSVGYAVNPRSVQDIANKVLKLWDDYDAVSQRCTEMAMRFSWQQICGELERLYAACV